MVRLVEGVWQALCLLATSWRKRPCWGTRCSPNPPEKHGQNVSVLSQKKRLEMCPFRSLFLARSSRFFRRWRRKKMALYALSFFGSWSEKKRSLSNKKDRKHPFSKWFSIFYSTVVAFIFSICIRILTLSRSILNFFDHFRLLFNQL